MKFLWGSTMSLLKKPMKITFAFFFFCTLSVSAQATNKFCGSIQEDYLTGAQLVFGMTLSDSWIGYSDACGEARVSAYKAMQSPEAIAFFTNPAQPWKATCPKEGCMINGVKDPDMTNKVMKIYKGTGINSMFGVCNFMKIYKKSSAVGDTKDLITTLLKDAC
jgi:hypothetical protein